MASNNRWDVISLVDPWWQTTSVIGTGNPNSSGFCATGLIPENTGETVGGCRTQDKQLAMFHGCVNKPMSTCYQQFCTKYASKLTFPGVAAKPPCVAFMKMVDTNYLAASCAVAKMDAPADPSKCAKDKDCQKCMDDITDFPDEINVVLGAKVNAVATSPPTNTCPKDLVDTGLRRKKLSQETDGIQIEYQDPVTKNWNSVFALLDSEIASCGGCRNVMNVNGSVASNQALLTPGKYRIKQCTGLDTNPNQALCDGALGYNATVLYSNPLAGGSLSKPYGALFDSGALLCSSKKYPNCPLDYQCCVWDKATQTGAWKSCMQMYHGGGEAYPKCGQ
jgi:hypothetical protein